MGRCSSIVLMLRHRYMEAERGVFIDGKIIVENLTKA